MPARKRPSPPIEAAPELTAAEYVAIGSLVPWDKNPRRNTEAIGPVAASIVRFGFGAPIVARRADRAIIAGHTRREAALSLRATYEAATPDERLRWHPEAIAIATADAPVVPVRFLDLTEPEARALALADNRLGELADWDEGALAASLRELAGQSVDLAGLGWNTADLSALIAQPIDLGPDPDLAPDLPTVPQSRMGEWYQLGPHWLFCGDANDADWSKLGEIDCVWTDPPYGVGYVGKTAKSLVIQNDKLGDAEQSLFLKRILSAVLAHSPGGRGTLRLLRGRKESHSR